MYMFCRSLFVLLLIFFWPLCCLCFFDIRILITPLISSNSSYTVLVTNINKTNNHLSPSLAEYKQDVIYLCVKMTLKKGKYNKQWSTKHIHKTKDRVTRTPLITMGELRCPGRISSSWSTSGSRRVSLVTNPVISDEWGKCLRQVEHIRGYFLTQIFHSGQLSFHNSIIVWALLLLDRQCCLCNNIFEHFQHDMTMWVTWRGLSQ
jgi:hypothetical protein